MNERFVAVSTVTWRIQGRGYKENTFPTDAYRLTAGHRRSPGFVFLQLNSCTTDCNESRTRGHG